MMFANNVYGCRHVEIPTFNWKAAKELVFLWENSRNSIPCLTMLGVFQGESKFTHTIQSTASMRDRSLVGRPMASRMMAMVMMPPAGMPAAPTLEAVAVTLQVVATCNITVSKQIKNTCNLRINALHFFSYVYTKKIDEPCAGICIPTDFTTKTQNIIIYGLVSSANIFIHLEYVSN